MENRFRREEKAGCRSEWSVPSRSKAGRGTERGWWLAGGDSERKRLGEDLEGGDKIQKKCGAAGGRSRMLTAQVWGVGRGRRHNIEAVTLVWGPSEGHIPEQMREEIKLSWAGGQNAIREKGDFKAL